MKSMRIALLAAAAMAVVPGTAWADRDRQDHGDRGNRGGGDQSRPAPPQAQQQQQHGSGMVMPNRAPDAGRPTPPQAPQAQPQVQRQDRGNWQGGNRGAGNWQNRGDARPDRPQQAANPVADTGQARAQWHHDGNVAPQLNDRRDDGRNDGRNDGRWNNGNRNQWTGGNPGRGDDHRFDANNRNDNRPNGGDRNQWNNGRGNDRDHRWDGNRGSDNHGNDGRWDRGRGGNDHRWDAGRWRNDNRYDWRDWRNNHRSLFSRHYYAPRGGHYRSVYAGFFLEPFFYGSSYWLGNPYDYRLPPAQWPLQWVHYYNDALLVDVTSGEVVDVIPNFFY